ncbi:hypothetical protein TNCT_107551 [Trichonephila clavata]|uniref:Uncharacterized protein n=1 Tax=Trichonephila clavata TaxID=2740835 RepID=A0A8X6LML7_TRICU|nr:hypothetical protein TNCT_107551 [Trichonephila clavata]
MSCCFETTVRTPQQDLNFVRCSFLYSTFRKGSEGRLAKEEKGSLWRLLWQPAWHPRGGSTVVLKKPDMGESSDGNGEGQGCDEAAQHEGSKLTKLIRSSEATGSLNLFITAINENPASHKYAVVKETTYASHVVANISIA